MNHKVFFMLLVSLIFFAACKKPSEKIEKITMKAVGQPKNEFVKKIILSGNTTLAFAKKDTIFDLYYEPFFIVNNKHYSLEGFNNKNRSNGDILGVSPNGNYFVMDYLTVDYVNRNGENILHENYFCVVIDIQSKQILHQMQSDCGGEWNRKNQWISAGKVVVTMD
jgi:hypothetical protein